MNHFNYSNSGSPETIGEVMVSHSGGGWQPVGDMDEAGLRVSIVRDPDDTDGGADWSEIMSRNFQEITVEARGTGHKKLAYILGLDISDVYWPQFNKPMNITYSYRLDWLENGLARY